MYVYTDGSCRMTVGGWAWWNEWTEESESGVEVPSTNQRMELYAALDAVDHHLDDPELVIVSDSAYLVNCMNDEWHLAWEARNWHTAKGSKVANQDIWRPLLGLCDSHGSVKFQWVKGHSGDPGNDMADKLATYASALALGDG